MYKTSINPINTTMKGSDKVGKTRRISSSESIKKGRPALTPEARENQLISYAIDLAEQQLRDGTASSQVITHFLKLGSTKASLEKAKLEHETELLRAKKDAIQNSQHSEELYTQALEAMQTYKGLGGTDEY